MQAKSSSPSGFTATDGLSESAVSAAFGAHWMRVPCVGAPGDDSSAGAARLGLAALLNSIWPENGSVSNRHQRLQRNSSATILVLVPAGAPSRRVLGSASIRGIEAARDGPEVAGVAAACSSACVLFSLLVDVPLQRHGLGSALLRRTEAEASSDGHSHVFLMAEDSLVGFYQRHGYEVVSKPTWKQRTRKPQKWMRKALGSDGGGGGGGGAGGGFEATSAADEARSALAALDVVGGGQTGSDG